MTDSQFLTYRGGFAVISQISTESDLKRPIHLGAVSYLNTKPLIYGLQEQLGWAGQLHLALPSRLADELKRGAYDVALIPSIEFFRNPEYSIISDACIACCGEVWSVKLLFRVPPSQVRTIALDEGSRTSATLAKILLHNRFGIRPSPMELPIHGNFRESPADAVLIIGDRAMGDVSQGFVESWDLGQEWFHDTGLPFVFAMWVGPSTNRDAEIASLLERARDDGCNHVDTLARKHAAEYGLTFDQCHKYLSYHLHFRLGNRERAGLQMFYDQAGQLGLAPNGNKHVYESLAIR